MTPGVRGLSRTGFVTPPRTTAARMSRTPSIDVGGCARVTPRQLLDVDAAPVAGAAGARAYLVGASTDRGGGRGLGHRRLRRATADGYPRRPAGRYPGRPRLRPAGARRGGGSAATVGSARPRPWSVDRHGCCGTGPPGQRCGYGRDDPRGPRWRTAGRGVLGRPAAAASAAVAVKPHRLGLGGRLQPAGGPARARETVASRRRRAGDDPDWDPMAEPWGVPGRRTRR